LSASDANTAHVAVRIFSERAPAGIEDRQNDVRELTTAVDGFHCYAVIGTDSGGVTVVAGKDNATTDEVGKRMGEWVRAQGPDFSRPAPRSSMARACSFTAQPTPA
jgi:hypothetical protein